MLGFLFVADDALEIADDARGALREESGVGARRRGRRAGRASTTSPPPRRRRRCRPRSSTGLGIKPRFAFTPLRVALSGRRISPPLFESMEILGKESTLARIAALRAYAVMRGRRRPLRHRRHPRRHPRRVRPRAVRRRASVPAGPPARAAPGAGDGLAGRRRRPLRGVHARRGRVRRAADDARQRAARSSSAGRCWTPTRSPSGTSRSSRRSRTRGPPTRTSTRSSTSSSRRVSRSARCRTRRSRSRPPSSSGSRLLDRVPDARGRRHPRLRQARPAGVRRGVPTARHRSRAHRVRGRRARRRRRRPPARPGCSASGSTGPAGAGCR